MGVNGKHRKLVIRALLALWLAVAPMGAAACGVSIVFGLDVSSSVDDEEHRIQLEGLVTALRSKEVATAILSTEGGGIWAAAFSWSGQWNQTLLADWTWLDNYPAIVAFSTLLKRTPRGVESWPTALGRATAYAAQLHRRAPKRCGRRVIDISGDGVNNDGLEPVWYRNRGDFKGLVINGLVIQGADPDPLPYYLKKVIHGPGAFVEVARNYDDYPRAIRRKLLRELAPLGLAQLKRNGGGHEFLLGPIGARR